MFRFLRRAWYLVLLPGVLAASGSVAKAQVAFSPSKSLSNYAGTSFAPQMIRDSKGNLDVIWTEDNTAQPRYDVFFSRSTDGGLTFSTPVNVSQNPGAYTIQQAWMAVDPSGNIYVVWRLIGGNLFPPQGNIYFSRSTDGGAAFSQWIGISQNPAGEDPQIAVDSKGNVNVVWPEIDQTSFGEHVEFTRSTDTGSTFSTPKQITPEDGTSGRRNVYLVVESSGGIYVMWGGFHTHLAHSSDAGATFSDTDLGQSSYGACGSQPTICNPFASPLAIDSSGNINMALFQENSTSTGPTFSRSTDGGATFSTPALLSSAPFGIPKIGVDSKGVIRIFGTVPGIPFFRSTDGGSTFSPVQSAVPTAGSTSYLLNAADSNGNIHLVWVDTTSGNSDVYWSVSTDGGLTYSSAQNVSNDPGPSNNPVFAFDSQSNVYVTWYGSATTNNSSFGILFSRSISLSSVSLNPASIAGGNSTTGTVTLSAPAFDGGNGGTDIWMSVNDWNLANVPDPVMVPAGATTATFNVGSVSVAQPSSVTISGSFAGATQSATLTLIPPALTGESLSASTITGGSTASGTVTLNAQAPAGGIVISLSSSNPATASVPASVNVPQWATSASFDINTSAVAQQTPVTISSSSGSVTQTASLTVTPPILTALTVDASSVQGGGGCTSMVGLSGPAPAGGAVISLSSSDPNTASVPLTVTVHAGASIVYFSVSTSPVAQPTPVTISASYQGTAQSVSFTVTP